jgi:hypothetical protein
MNNRKLEIVQVRQFVLAVLDTRSDELDCSQCLDELDRFVEMELAGLDAAQLMPLLKHHLDHCRCCYEESEALLAALRLLESS